MNVIILQLGEPETISTMFTLIIPGVCLQVGLACEPESRLERTKGSTYKSSIQDAYVHC